VPSTAATATTSRVAPLSLVTGDEEYLVSRALEDLRRAVRAAHPDVEVHEVEATSLDPIELLQLLSPSLFGGERLILVRNAQDIPTASVASVIGALVDAGPDMFVVVQHLAGAKGKAVLDAVRKAKPAELTCLKLSRAEDRVSFVRDEVRRGGGKITPDAVAAVLDAVGNDLREIAAAVAQLLGDNDGAIDAHAVSAFHRGRAEVTGFVVAEHAVTGNVTAALTNLRWALNVGVAPVLIADALADGVRSVARVMAAGPGDPFKLAPALGMPPWKVKKARGQARGWTESGLRNALGIVASLNAEVKGEAADPLYALEAAVRNIAASRSPRH